jgi:hypothetical protein
MNRPAAATWLALALALAPPAPAAAEAKHPGQFLLLNRKAGPASHRFEPVPRADFEEIKRALPDVPGASLRVGVGYIFSYFQARNDEVLLAALRRVLELAAGTDTPVLLQMDGENWWDARPDLWNWWDPAAPGFNPANRENVEWSGWSPDQALKIAWRNWGKQLRVRPPPNLLNPRYRKRVTKRWRC